MPRGQIAMHRRITFALVLTGNAVAGLALVLLILDPERFLMLTFLLCGIAVLLVYVLPGLLRSKT
jgi:hypothetical protein